MNSYLYESAIYFWEKANGTKNLFHDFFYNDLKVQSWTRVVY